MGEGEGEIVSTDEEEETKEIGAVTA